MAPVTVTFTVATPASASGSFTVSTPLAPTAPVVVRVSTRRCGAWAEKRARPSGPNQPLMSTTTWVGAELKTHTEPSPADTPTMAPSAVSWAAT